MSDFRTEYLSTYFDEVSPMEFYRGIFPEGELQKKGASGDLKYNAIAVELLPKGEKRNTKRYTITDDLEKINELVEHDNFILLSPISYVGRSREAKNARFIYALAIDLDGVKKEGNMIDLFHQIQNVSYLPCPTYVVSSGNGLHIYYVFEKPLPCFKNIVEQLAKLKNALTKKLWNGYVTAFAENVQYQSIFQGFRLVGGVTKDGAEADRTRAFMTGGKVSVEYLNGFVAPENQMTEFAYKSKLTLAEAKQKYPEWHQKRIEQGMPKGSWTCNRGLYDWWKGKISAEIVEGHRYYGVMCLAIYAKKCGIPRKELEADAFGMLEQLDARTKDNDNHFVRSDILSALEMYNDSYITFPIESISQLTNVRIDRNKRNGRKQEQHLKIARGKKFIMAEVGEDVLGGRPDKAKIVEEWQKRHPQGKKADCIRETGLSKPTVLKWWRTDIEPVVEEETIKPVKNKLLYKAEITQQIGRLKRY
jgi:hypothetical protein